MCLVKYHFEGGNTVAQFQLPQYFQWGAYLGQTDSGCRVGLFCPRTQTIVLTWRSIIQRLSIPASFWIRWGGGDNINHLKMIGHPSLPFVLSIYPHYGDLTQLSAVLTELNPTHSALKPVEPLIFVQKTFSRHYKYFSSSYFNHTSMFLTWIIIGSRLESEIKILLICTFLI